MSRRLVVLLCAVLMLTACNGATPSGSSERETGSSPPPEAQARTTVPAPVRWAERRTAGAVPLARQVTSAPRAPGAQGAGGYLLLVEADRDLRAPSAALDREQYAHFDDNPVKRVAEHPVSTFGLDVDTGSYTNVRRFLGEGRLPPRDAVRTEELLNYFTYGDPAPADRDTPFAVTTEIAPSPWNPKTHLLRIGLKAWAPAPAAVPPASLVFLVDVSGSMSTPDKLPLVKGALRLLVGELDREDRVALVVYAGASGVVLEPTAGDRKASILAAIEALEAGGPTHGAAGIELAYAKAREAFIPGGINRVLLATDGDFNVGTVSHEALVDRVARERAGGIALTTLGFGRGNFNDRLLEQLADHGDGQYVYIDNLGEARRVLVESLGGTLLTVARDAKVQVEFNPAAVAEYRLIGYENRQLRREDFGNDRVDAGDVGAGHSVTALYELALVGSGGERIERLRYGQGTAAPATGDELGFVRVRYKRTGEDMSQLIEFPIGRAAVRASLAQASDDLRFAAAVAAFSQRLRGGTYLEGFDDEALLALACGARGADPEGYCAEFVLLVRLAQALQPEGPAAATSAPPAGGETGSGER